MRVQKFAYESLMRFMKLNSLRMQYEMIRNHKSWGIYIYGRLGEPTCLQHIDGRRKK